MRAEAGIRMKMNTTQLSVAHIVHSMQQEPISSGTHAITTAQLPEPHSEELVSNLTHHTETEAILNGSLIYRIGSIIINFLDFYFIKFLLYLSNIIKNNIS